MTTWRGEPTNADLLRRNALREQFKRNDLFLCWLHQNGMDLQIAPDRIAAESSEILDLVNPIDVELFLAGFQTAGSELSSLLIRDLQGAYPPIEKRIAVLTGSLLASRYIALGQYVPPPRHRRLTHGAQRVHRRSTQPG